MDRKPLRLLLAEDLDDDALLVLNALERHGYEVTHERVMSADGFRAALASGHFEIILCDYVMPSFDAIAALEILKASGKDIPLIIVSGTIGESVAVDAMLNGAADYILKENLIRLGAAVDREIRDAEVRRQKQIYDSLSQAQTEVLELILDGVPLARILERIVERAQSLFSSGAICSIMLANPERTHLTLGAGPDLPPGFIDGNTQIPIGKGYGSCGTCAALGKAVVVETIAGHPDWGSAAVIAESCGLRSCWSVPVFSSDRGVLGTMSVYHLFSHAPLAEEIRWIESAATLASLAIERTRVAENLHASEALMRIASEAGHIGGWTVDLPEMRITWSDQVCAIHEVPPGYVPPLDEALNYYTPEWRGKMAAVFERCAQDGIPFDEEMEIITAKGRRVWIRSIGECTRDSDGVITRVQGAFQDTSEKHKAMEEAEFFATSSRRAEERTRASEQRYLLQRNALISLTKDIPSDGVDILDAFHRITETSANTLGVARVSIWRYSEDRETVMCLDLYERDTDRHSSGDVLVVEKYPSYFEALRDTKFIAADNARIDERTREFTPCYLEPHGITSMMDVPIHYGSGLDYFICHEHTGPLRAWTADEKTFAVALANLVSLALESSERARAQQEVLRSHQRFQSVAAATNDTIWDWNLETDAFWWSDGFANLFGWSTDESAATVRAWIRQIHPEDRPRVVDGVYSAIRGSASQWIQEYRFISNDGTVAHVIDRAQIIRDEAGKGIRMVGGMTDLTASKAAEMALERSHRALQMLSSCNEMLIRATAEDELLVEACGIAVDIGGYRMAWVGYALEDELRRVIPMAHAGAEDGYLSEVEVTWSEHRPTGIGPAGQAIRNGRAVFFEDVSTRSEFFSQEAARSRGYRSVICLPLKNAERVFGVLCLYGSEPHPASPEELKMLQDMANDLAFGIGNIRSREERQRAQDVVVKVAQAVSTGTGSEFFDLLTMNMVEAMGGIGGGIGKHDPVLNAIDTISFVMNGKLMDSVHYALDGTPCHNVTAGELCIFESGVQQLFPDDHMLVEMGIEAYAGVPLFHQNGGVAGIMMVLFEEPMRDTALVHSTLKIFAARAAAELDRQQADARIREQASLLDKAQDAILVRDLDHNITYWNKSAERLYGWTAAEAVGRSVKELLYRDTGAFGQAHEHTLRAGEWVGEMSQIDKRGRDLSIEGRWTLVRDEDGAPVSVFVINTDISEHRKLEQQFLRAQRMESIGTLAGGIAHDLNNILAPISMAIELLKMRSPDSRSSELLDTISGSAHRAADMVRQVLSFARGMEGRRVEVHPRQLIAEIEIILRDTVLKQIELEVRAGRELWVVQGDPTQLHQVLLNLCVNARDALTHGGHISISADNVMIDGSFAAINLEATAGPHVCIRVTDDGEGIPQDIIDRIFDPFFTTKSVGKGTGLGLSTSLAIVKSHGGFIRVESRSGLGTTFKVYLPAHPEISSQEPVPGHVELPAGNGELVLVVDDEESIRQITRQTLDAFGYRTLLASDGSEAISLYAAKQSDICVVLTDMMMPGMDGSETIERLMKINPSVKIIATSGVTANRGIAETAGSAVRDFLQKPYTAETLLKCLKQVILDTR
ncbi:MAG: GAF domain-containing protein [Verrucomicrobiaceae bacterium]|nr:MAG: GAF domain-containing protein [Verrucomicrobiaceae bacterium]